MKKDEEARQALFAHRDALLPIMSGNHLVKLFHFKCLAYAYVIIC